MRPIGATRMDGSSGVPRIAGWKMAAAVTCCGVVVALVVAVMHVLRVHRDYGVWAWSPSAGTPSIQFRHRRYVQPHSARVGWSAQDLVVGATAPGDGQIFAPGTARGAVPTILVIEYPNGRTLVYVLVGAP
jgi:hypothetical protein